MFSIVLGKKCDILLNFGVSLHYLRKLKMLIFHFSFQICLGESIGCKNRVFPVIFIHSWWLESSEYENFQNFRFLKNGAKFEKIQNSFFFKLVIRIQLLGNMSSSEPVRRHCSFILGGRSVGDLRLRGHQRLSKKIKILRNFKENELQFTKLALKSQDHAVTGSNFIWQ